MDELINNVNLSDFTDANSFIHEIRRRQQQLGVTSKVDLSRIIDEEDSNIKTKIKNNDELREVTKKLLQIEDELNILNEKAKIRRTIKSGLRTQIVEFMSKNEVELLNLPDGGYFSLRINKKKVNPITKKRLPICLVNYLMKRDGMTKEEAIKKKDEMMQFFLETAEQVESSTLRRIK